MSTANPLPALTLPQMLREQSKRIPKKLALRQKDFGIWLPYTWKEYYRLARRFGMALLSIGVEPGAKVGILSENKAEWVISQMGAGIVSCITVGVYPTSPTPEVSYVVGHADVEIIVCEDQEQADKILEARALGELPRIKKIVVIDMRGLTRDDSGLIISFKEFAKLGAAHEEAHPGLADAMLDKQSLDDEALMIYTSGSTGKPKGAIITYRNVRAGAWGTVDRLALHSESTALSYLPLCHVAEQFMTNFGPIYLGCTVSFGESIRTVQKDLREIGPSYFLGVPRIWEKLHSEIHIKINEAGGLRKRLYQWAMNICEPIRSKRPKERSLVDKAKLAFFYWLVFRALQNFLGLRNSDLAMSGAAPIAPEVFKFFRTIGIPLAEGYGATELSGVVTCHNLDNVVPGTVGIASASVDLKLSAEGEILVSGEHVFKGYYKNEEETRASIVDGWYHTGDVAVWEGDNLKIIDRIKDIMITAGGKNLSPSGIENSMKASPFIKECIVIGDRRKFVAALIQIDFESVAAWAEEQRIAFTTFKSLTENPEVFKLISEEVATANKGLAPVGNVRKFHLLTRELDHDDGEVTATMKIKRSNIYDKYEAEIEGLY
jgi:long-chain acyl-CoA synthetase